MSAGSLRVADRAARIGALLSPWGLLGRPRAATLGMSTVLLGAGLTLLPFALAGPRATVPARLTWPWWVIAALFAAAGLLVSRIEFDNQVHVFTLSETPLLLGLLFGSPRDLVLARVLGEAVLLVLRRRRVAALKIAFNLSLFFAGSVLALAVLRMGGIADVPDPAHPRAWGLALLCVIVVASLEAAVVWAAIRLHGGQESLRRSLLLGVVTAAGNGALGVVAAILLVRQPVALVPLALLGGVVAAAYRGYSRLAKRYKGLELLYQFTKITSGPSQPDRTLGQVLDQARQVLRARYARVELWQPGHASPWLAAGAPASAPGGPLNWGEVPLPEELRREVLEHRRTVLVPRRRRTLAQQRVAHRLGIQECLAAPLLNSGAVSGVLVVGERVGAVSGFDAEDARLLTTLASQAAIAIEHGRLIERLHEQVAAREHDATHDALTGLANRSLFTRRLAEALAVRPRGRLAVLLMDLDSFKDVNDTLGHHIGDQLLGQVAERLDRAVGDGGSVARLGGDEFAVMLPDVAGLDEARAAAARVHAAVTRPVRLDTVGLEVGASMGVALSPQHGTDPTTLLQRADVAMYAAKDSRSGVVVYDTDLDWNSELRLRLAGELRNALGTRQFEVHYQPISRAADGRVVGVEALARWRHPWLGRISPDVFVPIAERTGLIHDLTVHVLDRALARCRMWRDNGVDIGVSVNLSVVVLRDVGWPAKVAALLAEHGVPPDRVTFEITETAIMSDPTRMIRTLEELAGIGTAFAIDDFGCGYSSLAHLQQLPVTELKIDKSFVRTMSSDPVAAAIVRSVADLARSLGLSVVAEGVEDAETLEQLVAAGCGHVQGYLVSRPRAGDELTRWMLEGGADAASPRAQRVGRGPTPVAPRGAPPGTAADSVPTATRGRERVVPVAAQPGTEPCPPRMAPVAGSDLAGITGLRR